MVLFSPMPDRRRKVLAAAHAEAGTADLLAPYELDFKVVLRDHDVLGHFTNIRYNQLAQLSREAWMIRTGMDAGDQGFTVASEDMTFIKMMRSGMAFSMVTQLETWSADTLVFSHNSHTPKRQTGAGICILRLNDGPLNVPALLSASGVNQPPPKPNAAIKPYLA